MKKLFLLITLLLYTSLTFSQSQPARHSGGVILGDPIGTSSDPTGVKAGYIYWNDTLKVFRKYNGTTWSSLVTGLKSINEGAPSNGYVLADRVDANYGNIGEHAVDLSFNFTPSTTAGAGGSYSFVAGEVNSIQGGDSAWGAYILGAGNTISGTNVIGAGILGNLNTITNGYGVTAIGSYNTISTADNGFGAAIGMNNLLTGTAPSGAFGTALIAKSRHTFAVGVANVDYTETGNEATRPIFVVGNGTTSTPAGAWAALTRSDAFRVDWDGTITAPSLSDAEIVTAGATALITKGYADNNFTTSGGLKNISDDTNPQLGGVLDVLGFIINTSILNADIRLVANGTGKIKANNEIEAADDISIIKLDSTDPVLTYVATGAFWTSGIDNSDGNKFKIDNGVSLGVSAPFEMTTAGITTVQELISNANITGTGFKTNTGSGLNYFKDDGTLGLISDFGDVNKVGTPVNNQYGLWTGNGTIEGDPFFTADTFLDTSFRRIQIGIDDTNAGYLDLFGHSGAAANSGINIYNNADVDTEVDVYSIRPHIISGDLDFVGTGGTGGGSYITFDATTGGIKAPSMSDADIVSLGATALTTKGFNDNTYGTLATSNVWTGGSINTFETIITDIVATGASHVVKRAGVTKMAIGTSGNGDPLIQVQNGIFQLQSTGTDDINLNAGSKIVTLGLAGSKDAELDIYGDGFTAGASIKLFNAGGENASTTSFSIVADSDFKIFSDAVPALIIDDVTKAVTIDNTTISEINTLGAKAVITKEYLDAKEKSKSFIILNPGAAEDRSIFFTNKAITITEIHSTLIGSATPSVTWTIRHGTDRSLTGAEVITSGTITTNSTTGDVITSFNDGTVIANSHVWFETTAQSGTVTEQAIEIFYTED